jgi:hypothetical protein
MVVRITIVVNIVNRSIAHRFGHLLVQYSTSTDVVIKAENEFSRLGCQHNGSILDVMTQKYYFKIGIAVGRSRTLKTI